MIDGMIPLKEVAERIRMRYSTLLWHVNQGKFPDAQLKWGTRWFIPLATVKKIESGEFSFSAIKRGPKKESSEERKIVKFLKERGYFAVKIQGGGNKDNPDRAVIGPKNIGFLLEIKRPGKDGKLSKGQEKKFKELRAKGIVVIVCSSVDSLRRSMRKVFKEI